MFITNPHDLAQALLPILREKVVVRYAVCGLGYASFYAELVVLAPWSGEEYLGRATVSVEAYRGNTEIKTDFRATGLAKQPDALDQVCNGWSSRDFDDWMHAVPFMGAYEVFRDRMPYTSIKLQAWDDRWNLLTGAVLAEVEKFAFMSPDEGNASVSVAFLMRRRFKAFAAQAILTWAHANLTAA